MNVGLRLYWIEARRSTAIWFVPVVLAITWYFGRQQHAADVTLWSKTSVQLGEPLIVLGPLTGGLAAWVASRDRRRGTEDLLATVPRSPVTRDLLGYGATLGWGLFAYVAAVLIVFAMTYRTASWGSPDPLPVVAAMATITFSGAVGYVAGLCFPSRFTPPLVAIALALALILPMSGATHVVAVERGFHVTYESLVRTFTPVNYVYPGDYDPYYDSWPGITLPLIAWLASITGIALVAMALYRRRTAVVWALLLVCILGASIAGSQLYGTVESGRLESRGGDPEQACQDGRVTVCVHPAYEAALDDVAVVIHDLTEPVAGLPGVPSRIEQLQSNVPVEFRRGDLPEGTLGVHIHNWIFVGGPGRASDAEGIVSAIICGSGCREPWQTGFRFGDPARTVVGTWLLEHAGIEPAPLMSFQTGSEPAQPEVDEAIERFAALEPDERRAWLEQYFVDLRAGRLTLDDLP